MKLKALLSGLVVFAYDVLAFVPGKCQRVPAVSTSISPLHMTATADSFDEKPTHFLMEEFCIYSGEPVNPYVTLRVSREADPSAIRRAYIRLSKLYHPDSLRSRESLPTKCRSVDDVRKEWERVKLAYEILSDKRRRQRYDRHEMIADPKAAMGRAAMGAVSKGIVGIGKGIFNAGAFAVDHMTSEKEP